MNDEDQPHHVKLNGCAWIAIAFLLAFATAALYILFMFGSWIGQQ